MRGAVVATPQGEIEIRAAQRRRAGRRRLPERRAAAQGAVPAHADRPGASGVAAEELFGRRHHAGRIGRRLAGHRPGVARRVGAGVEGAALRRHVGHFPHIIDRAKPGVIGVLANGKRFVNEADGYYDYTAAMVAAVPEGEEVASWLDLRPPLPAPIRPRYSRSRSRFRSRRILRSGYLKRGATIEELAEPCGIDPPAWPRPSRPSTSTRGTARIPSSVAARRRTTASRATRCSGPNPCVAPIEHGPFYAVKVLPGSFGTFAGLKTNGFGAGARRATDGRSPACTPWAPTWPASWAASTRPAASTWARR